ncbi:zinc finger protein 618 isoform X5 [Zootoca vivipara]|uniref:zinc finger protein 618 isoform X5 n=1 Tax=Zootoca vivipara TaxID=8524 RepID=UPI00293B887A|nr:zinc finger protein 618 isoform X5 [Zootoca vivipara]
MKDPPAAAEGSPPPDGGGSEEEEEDDGEKEEGEKGGEEETQAEGSSSSAGRRASANREPCQPIMKPEGSDSPASESSPSEDPPPALAAEVKVKTETPDDFAWPPSAEEGTRKGARGATAGGAPAEICVVLGGVRGQQTLGKLGSYECGICGKKYKYYNCFQTHVRAHRDTEVASGEGASQGKTGSYTCEFCGKQYKYYTPYQEHVALHAPIKYSRSPLLVAVKTHAGKKAPPPAASIIRCSALLHRAPSGASQLQMFRAPNSGSPGSKATTESVFSRRVESKMQNNYDETNSSSQNSSEPYTCGACGIQFQFYNNLLEHMQSHAADNENSMASHQPRSPPPAAPEEKWKPPPPAQRDTADNAVPEKERQVIAERLLRLLCAEPASLSVVSGPEFLKLAQVLVDSGARHGAFPAAEALGNLSALALQQLPRMYNQAKVKVTCALGTGACRGIGVTCHAQGAGPDSCHVLTAHRAEAGRIRSYVLAVRGGTGGEPIHRWAQNVLSEFVTPETRAAYVTDGSSAHAFSKAGLGLRCAACALNAAVRGVLSPRALQARGMPEVSELLGACQDLAGSPGAAAEAFGSPAPPCWDSPADALLAVHERYEQICEFYGRGQEAGANPAPPGLNRPLLANLAALLAPVKQAVSELGAEGRPTLQLVLPTYVRLEKLFTAKAGDAGPVSKLCHLFLEALKENFKLHAAHKVAMVLDPRQKLRPVPPYQHEEIVAKVCQLLGVSDEAEPEPAAAKKPRGDSDEPPPTDEAEVYSYLQEPLATTPDLFQYWSGAQHPRLAKLAFWLLAVPAVGARTGCARLCEQAVLIRRRRLLGPEDANKLIFLKANMP